jgi:hypothetical protein
MEKKILQLRFCYWVGALFDGLTLIPMLFPRIGGMLFGIPDFNPGAEYRYAMGVGAALMAGWTVLLLWADRKPADRRGLLLLSLFPVLSGLILAGIYAVACGMAKPDKMAPLWIFQAAVFTLFSVTYIQSRPASGR